jgi:hypothetical protein
MNALLSANFSHTRYCSWYGDPRPDFCCCQTVAGLLMWGALPDERTGRSFTIALDPLHCSYSWVRVLQDSWRYFTVSDSTVPQPGGPVPFIYIPQEQDGPIILQALGSSFVPSNDSQGYGGCVRTRLHEAELPQNQSQNYFTTGGLPSISLSWRLANFIDYNISARATQKTPSLSCCSIVAWWTAHQTPFISCCAIVAFVCLGFPLLYAIVAHCSLLIYVYFHRSIQSIGCGNVITNGQYSTNVHIVKQHTNVQTQKQY